MTSLGRPQDFNFEHLMQKKCCCIISDLTSAMELCMLHQMCCVKYWKVSCCMVLQFWIYIPWTSSNRLEKTSIRWRPWDVPKMSILNLSYKCIFFALFSILFHQVCDWNTKELALLQFCVFVETSQRHRTNVPKWYPEGDVYGTSLGRQFWT